jgi:hypothetical protein
MVLTSSPTPDGAIYAYDPILKLGYCRVSYTKYSQSWLIRNTRSEGWLL